jgi:hypothetical protein
VKATDPEALRAMLSDRRSMVRQWRCSVGNGRCRTILATEWATPDGLVLQWAAPGEPITREDRQAFIEAGIRKMMDGFVSHVQFEKNIDIQAPIECSCDNHGRQTIDARPTRHR